MYNYFEEEKNDVMQIINDKINFKDFYSLDELEENLNDRLFIADSVTGNASGSYTFSTYEAEKNLCGNMDLLKEALEEYGEGLEALEQGAEFLDVTIRCYLLPQVIADCMEEIKDDFEAAQEEARF